jgi:hypothetical protein
MSETLTTPTAFCRPGEGAACCAFLMLNTEATGHDLVCAKGTNMEEFLRMRRETKKLKAQGDNCSGPPNFTPASAAGRERETARGNDGREWNRQPGVDCVECPDCGFTFDAAHRDEDGTYSCPNCLAPERGGEEETQ